METNLPNDNLVNEEFSRLSKYERAKTKVASIKRFYNHALVFLLINVILYFLRHKFVFILVNKNALGNPEFLDWINWNVYGTTIVWGFILAIHALIVFGNISGYMKRWEEREIQKHINSYND
ncbi:2TM domain-containing protein [Maribacter sp. BPC-D8]|uniref:2TM domain-containing protein n=1 Tax=Maribacter sp. BPC-D8 TaxID=3053613 RepID=UPI002B4763A0|nr:2TM domain-containing protein [Maribacter sp. BPC-D8]WRI30244.1 2TM domain-containing protein [Maribacter sp. BPC-D8]